MRILANYGYKTNGDMYSVTFETIGDVPATQAPQAVDELFRLAREAVQRQINGATAPTTQLQTPVTTSPTAVAQPVSTNGKKPHIKDPGLPATPKQIKLLTRLAREKSQWIEALTDLTMGEASSKIEELMAV